jgi:hypothetical protein
MNAAVHICCQPVTFNDLPDESFIAGTKMSARISSVAADISAMAGRWIEFRPAEQIVFVRAPFRKCHTVTGATSMGPIAGCQDRFFFACVCMRLTFIHCQRLTGPGAPAYKQEDLSQILSMS